MRHSAIEVICTEETLQRIAPSHQRGFEDRNLLCHTPIAEGQPLKIGEFEIHALHNDHFPGCANYLAEWEGGKVFIGWDMKSLPAKSTLLKDVSLALLEANTHTRVESGHTSVAELIGNGFLGSMSDSGCNEMILVHYGGNEDPGGSLADADQEKRIHEEYSTFADVVRMGRRGELWEFPTTSDDQVVFQLVNKDHAYWWQKRRLGQRAGGNTSGLLTYRKDEEVTTNILFDAGFGTIDGLCDLKAFDWSWPLTVCLTHAHLDHHAELLMLSDLWCKNRMV